MNKMCEIESWPYHEQKPNIHLHTKQNEYYNIFKKNSSSEYRWNIIIISTDIAVSNFIAL